MTARMRQTLAGWPTRAPMWVVRDGEIVRMRDMPGQPPAPCVEGKITRTREECSPPVKTAHATPVQERTA